MRKPFQGVKNIIRFNWHFYVLAIVAAQWLLCGAALLPGSWAVYAWIGLFAVMWNILVSLAVSYYVYDASGLYSFSWLKELHIAEGTTIANIHAGFDETSVLLAAKYPAAHMQVYDFYNPQKHTEVSIRRARAAYPPYPGTVYIDTDSTQFNAGTFDCIFLLFAAHEIRNTDERSRFFTTLKQSLRPGGCIIVAEHLRDVPNFMAYTIGFFHFYPKSEWLRTFKTAELTLKQAQKINPFITVFYLG